MIYSRYIECSQETYHSLTKKRFWTYVHDRGDTLTRLKVFTQVDARLLRLRISQRGTPAACASRLEFLSRYSRWGTPGRTALRSVLTEVFRLYGFDEGEIRQEHLWLRKICYQTIQTERYLGKLTHSLGAMYGKVSFMWKDVCESAKEGW